MVGASVLGVFLQSLPPDRRVAMARVASLIRRAARGVRESKRHGLVFYELSGSPLFALESREKSLTLYIAEQSVLDPFIGKIKGLTETNSLITFTDLNRLPLPEIEKLVRASVVARRASGTAPSETELLTLWGVNQEKAKVSDPFVRIPKGTAEEAAAQEAARLEAERLAAEAKKILKPTKHEKTRVEKIAEARAKSEAMITIEPDKKTPARRTAKKPTATKTAAAAKKAAAAAEPAAAEPAKKAASAAKASTKKASAPKKTAAKTVAAKKPSAVKTAAAEAKAPAKAPAKKAVKTPAKKAVAAKATAAKAPVKRTAAKKKAA